MQCDFCGVNNPAFVYPATDFIVHVKAIDPHGEITPIDWISNGEWMACDACSEFIDCDDWEEVIRRAPPMKVLVNLEHRRIMRETLNTVYSALAISRFGEKQHAA